MPPDSVHISRTMYEYYFRDGNGLRWLPKRAGRRSLSRLGFYLPASVDVTVTVGTGNSADAAKSRSEEGGTAVDVDGLAGDRAGLVGAEKKRCLCNFVGGLTATLEQGAEKAFELFLWADA